MKLPKSFTTVTPLSKYIAMFLFIILPLIGFYLGIKYQKNLQVNIECVPSKNVINEYIPITPNTPPDSTSDEPENIGTYKGVPINP